MKLPGSPTQRKWASRLAIVAAIGVAYYLFTQVLDLESILESVSKALGPWTYLLVGFFAFAETGAFIGLIAPGETVMLLGGAVAGQGTINLYVLIALAWTCACLGDVVSFFLGRRLGREFLMKHGPRFGFGHDRLEQVESFFSRHGGKTILLGRFVGFVRAFAPFIAGSSGMRFRQFFPYSVLGCGIWVSLTIVIGYVFSKSIETAIDYAGKGAVILGALIVVVVGVVWAVRYLRVAENRREAVRWMDDHRATAWITAFARRHEAGLRLIGDRLTPGGTFGLEFTSLMAVLAVAVFVLVAYIVVVDQEPRPDPRRRNRDRNRRSPPRRLHDRLLEGLHLPRLGLLHLAADGDLRGGACPRQALDRGLRPARRDGPDPDRLLGDQGGGRSAAAAAPARRHPRLLVPERPRLPLGPLRLAGDDDRRPPATRDGARGPRRHRGHRPHGAGRSQPRLPLRPLPERRQQRLGPRRRLFLDLRGGRPRRQPIAPQSASMIAFGLAKIGHQYVLFGIAALICLITFVTLILSPALNGAGRLWEKAAAGALSLFVLAALIVGGVVIGLVIVKYWPEIHEFFVGN